LSKKIIEAKEPRCEYCVIGKLSADGENILCPKKGVMNKDFSCKKFRYYFIICGASGIFW
jgi:hypothetical protein